MSYSDGWHNHAQRATMFVHEDERTAKVTYSNATGGKFSVIVRQKPNPIGFAVRLPGDRKRDDNR